MANASMTKQHFEAIAKAIATIDGKNLREKVAKLLAPVCKSFNENFQEGRFYDACNVNCCEEALPEKLEVKIDPWEHTFENGDSVSWVQREFHKYLAASNYWIPCKSLPPVNENKVE